MRSYKIKSKYTQTLHTTQTHRHRHKDEIEHHSIELQTSDSLKENFLNLPRVMESLWF